MELLNNFFLEYTADPPLVALSLVYISLAISIILVNTDSDFATFSTIVHLIINFIYVSSFVDESYVFLTRLCIFFIPYLILFLIGMIVLYIAHRLDR